jgi:DNA-binding NtrC family response regulator
LHPFYIIDCPSITESLFESELFGHEKDAFTGAKFKRGRLEEAQDGIVLINEIGELSLAMQAKLLHVLEKKEFTRVGSNLPIQLKSVILTATNRDLASMVRKELFREDLLQRLYKSVVVVNPPMRERAEDIPDLVAYFIRKFNLACNKGVRNADQELLDYLKKQSWPGNVRQLEHCIQTGVQNCPDDVLTLKDIASFLALFENSDSTGADMPISQNMNVDYRTHKNLVETMYHQLLKDYLLHHIVANNWNIAQTALQIGMSREYLNQEMKRYEIQRPNKL